MAMFISVGELGLALVLKATICKLFTWKFLHLQSFLLVQCIVIG